jgi:coproporphyrinogen III oxidase-like Fe-S oxidoreductase
MNRVSHTVTPVSAQAAIEESFFLGLRLSRGIDLRQLCAELGPEFGAELAPASSSRTFTNCHPEPSEGPAVSQKATQTLDSRQFREGHDFSRAISSAEATASAAEASRVPQKEFSPQAIATWESAIQQSLREGLLEQQATTLRLTARGRLLSNEVFARFLIEETKVGTGHVNPR